MTSVAGLSVGLGVAWAVTAAVIWRTGAPRAAAWGALVSAGHVVAALYAPAAPLLLATWLGFGLAFPQGELRTPGRRGALALGAAVLAAWTALLVPAGDGPDQTWFVTAALAITAVSTGVIALRCRKATPPDRAAVQWLSAATVLVLATDAVLLALNVMAGTPQQLRPWLVAPLLLVPAAVVAASLVTRHRVAETALIESIVVAGLACLVCAVYLVVVVGLGHTPEGAERGILVSSLVAAVVVAALAQPVRFRLVEIGTTMVSRQEASAEEVVSTFGARMSRAVPMDELMLQAAESLKATIASAGAEIWVGTDGALSRSVTVPARPAQKLVLGERERVVVGRARIGGPSWASVWLPAIAGERADDPDVADLRVAPVAHLGDLLGLIVVRRRPDAPAYTDDDDRRLVELARQLGLALHNVRLDSALQKSLEELEIRNAELQASRLRIVTASDESRRAIERNLHDGAQQHLVALAVKLGLAEAIAEDDPEMVSTLLVELRSDVQTTIKELRELAHGIYPPLLRDRGLEEALRAAANRSPLACTVQVDLPRRFVQEAETATYFCCLEAMQNAGKHAGPNAKLEVRVGLDAGFLVFSVTDDGAGFDSAGAAGHGFVNMSDRLGAIGGQLDVDSEPGRGTTIGGRIPLAAAELPAADVPAAELPAAEPAHRSVTG
jgi:signal transduction histidine kinase